MVANERLGTNEKGSAPIPDPTVLTTQQLLREVLALKELFDSRFSSYDKAITLLQAVADRTQSIGVIEERVKSLSGLYDEKFRSIATQFTERDTRTEQTSRDSKVAVDAALQAAKEAVAEQNKSSALAIAKSEAATAKQIDQLGVAFSATTTGITDKIDDIKDRITTIEGRGTGRHDAWGYAAGGFGLLIGLASVLVALAKG